MGALQKIGKLWFRTMFISFLGIGLLIVLPLWLADILFDAQGYALFKAAWDTYIPQLCIGAGAFSVAFCIYDGDFYGEEKSSHWSKNQKQR